MKFEWKYYKHKKLRTIENDCLVTTQPIVREVWVESRLISDSCTQVFTVISNESF